MRILCEYSPGGSVTVRNGWGNVFRALGHQFAFWDPEGNKPAFDIFAEYEPDILLACTYSVDKALFRCIASRPHLKVGLFASSWGPMVNDIDIKKYPIVKTNYQEQCIIEALYSNTKKPHFVFIHAPQRHLEGVLGGWRSIGVNPLSILNAADIYTYFGGEIKEEYVSDCSFVGGYWDYKARNLKKYILPLCHRSKKLNIKIWGNSSWPVANYLGVLEENESRDVFASAGVCPNVHEPHSTDLGLGDIVERQFKVPCAGGLVVSDKVDGMDDEDVFGPNVMPQADNPQDFEDLIRFYLSHPEERKEKIAQTRRVVLNHHCYHHRVATFFDHWDLHKEAAQCRVLHKELIAKLAPEVLTLGE